MTPPSLGIALHILRSEFTEAARHIDYDPTEGAPYAFFGSTVLALHGLRDQISDIDVFLDHRIWECCAGRLMWQLKLPNPDHPPYIEKYAAGYKVNGFYRWRADEAGVIDADGGRREAEKIGGGTSTSVYCIPLVTVRRHKIYSIDLYGDQGRWAKHATDLEAINRRMAA